MATVQPWVEVTSLYCPALEDHLDFQTLRNQLQAYITETHLPLHQRKMHLGRSQNWQRVVYLSLAAYLRRIAFSEDKSEQLQLLAGTKKWYWDRVSELPPTFLQGEPCTTNPLRSVSTYRRPRQVTRELFARKKMDIVAPIEARSVSPDKVRHSPVKPLPIPVDSFAIDWSRGAELATSPKESPKSSPNYVPAKRRALSMYRQQMEKWAKDSPDQPSSLPQTVTNSGSRRNSTDSEQADSTPPTRPDKPLVIEAVKGARLVDAAQFQRRSPLRRGRQREAGDSPLSKTFYRFAQQQLSPLSKTQYPADKLSGGFFEPQPMSREAKVAEVEDVKRRMVMCSVPCTYRTLTAGLLEPKYISKDLLTAESLPKGGELLTVNPFQDFASKKKSKRKK